MHKARTVQFCVCFICPGFLKKRNEKAIFFFFPSNEQFCYLVVLSLRNDAREGKAPVIPSWITHTCWSESSDLSWKISYSSCNQLRCVAQRGMEASVSLQLEF